MMSHQIIITVSDEAYAALAEAAKEKGQPVELLAQETLTQQYTSLARSELDPLIAHLYRAGKVRSLPTGRHETPIEKAAREQLAHSVKPGKSASEMVIEDRGPY